MKVMGDLYEGGPVSTMYEFFAWLTEDQRAYIYRNYRHLRGLLARQYLRSFSFLQSMAPAAMSTTRANVALTNELNRVAGKAVATRANSEKAVTTGEVELREQQHANLRNDIP
eukprot:CAMPEP_0119301576 /NCGR_PEP_ID=MMETSP1333-20130426/3339_1 /TAXON_ID=418940 /ORGANISM="Scyphosphaera apsteinii, Strain RCC1455" /LENGTH=112 /DNA_ID=CAMNT_0007303693 /DNA_START=73 /DNA_END=411 /DNA_ORIENTATION=+